MTDFAFTDDDPAASGDPEDADHPGAGARTESPRVTRLSWGTVETEDGGRFKDVKLRPGGAREWDWNETGTSHVPGIQVEDVEELVEAGAQEVVLSQGMNERLQVEDATLAYLEERGIAAHVLQTEEAVETYNELAAEGRPVGALVHSTC